MATISTPYTLHVDSPTSDAGRDYAEQQLQAYILRNPKILGIANATVIASEYPTEVGRIDILVGSGSQTLWVVELKAGTAGRDAIGQITSYIGAIRDEHPDKAVLGLLVAPDFDKQCLAAHRAVGDVELKLVRIHYELHLAVPMKLQSGHIPPENLKISPKEPSVVNGVATCSVCGARRRVTPNAQAYVCDRCKSFNSI